MTMNTCLCRLRFEQSTQNKASYDSQQDYSVVVEIESAVQPPETRQTFHVVHSLLEFNGHFQDSVLLYTGKDRKCIEIVNDTCNALNPVAVVVANEHLRAIPEATVPIFVLQPRIVRAIIALSGSQGIVSIIVLRPLPNHPDISANSSVHTEEMKSEDGTTFDEAQPPVEIVSAGSLVHNTSIMEHASVGMKETSRGGTARNVDVAWTTPRLDQSVTGKEVCCESSSKCIPTYPSFEGEAQMRRWLNDNKLPQDVGDRLIQVGVRDIEDITLLAKLNADSGIFNELAELDMLKLKQAVCTQKPEGDDGKEGKEDGKEERQEPTCDQGRLSKGGSLTTDSTRPPDGGNQAIERQRVVIDRLLDVLGAGFAVTTIRALCWQPRNGGIDPEIVLVAILVPSAIRSVWFAIPNSMWRPSLIISGHVDNYIGKSRGDFLGLLVGTIGSWVLFIIFINVLVATVCWMSGYLNPGKGQRWPLWIAMIGTILAGASVSFLTVCGALSIRAMFFVEAVSFASLSILAVCWLNTASVQILIDFGASHTSFSQREANAIACLAQVVTTGNFFFFTRVVLETLSVMIMMLVQYSSVATEMHLHSWLDICYVSKFIFELVVLVYCLEDLQES